MNGVQLQEVDHHPCLGVEHTSDLTWITHITDISNITTKANRILNLLCQHLYNGCNQEVQSRAFKLLGPHLEYMYSSSVWDPYFKQGILAVEEIQRKGACFVTSNYATKKVLCISSTLFSAHPPPLHHYKKDGEPED